MLKVLTIFGTRPEAVKMAPVVLDLKQHPGQFAVRVCVTGQHREMLDQVLELFAIVPDIDLDLMQPNQTLVALTARVMQTCTDVLNREKPDVVLVQGDTTTVMAVALAAFYQQIPVGHVEAGLRSNDRYSPFPEEINRRMASVLATYHFAPTATARDALLQENVASDQIVVTGNTVIDALHMIVNRPVSDATAALLQRVHACSQKPGTRLILVTAHRRENFGEPFVEICNGLQRLVERNEDVVVLYPVHLNPNVREPVFRLLGSVPRIILAEPVEYDTMVHLMNAAYLVLTDSGGIQEEAPALGKPVLVMRRETERPEAVSAGTARLVGPNGDRIVAETERLLRDPDAYEAMARAVSPYGDGHAAERLRRFLLENALN